MDELLKQIFCSVGAIYLVLRFGYSVTSLLEHLIRGHAYTKPNRIDPGQQ